MGIFKKGTLALLIFTLLFFVSGCGNVTQTTNSQAVNNESKSSTENKEEQKVNLTEKEITFIVPVSPGGSYDLISRTTAKIMEKYLPGKPTIIVKNMPGSEWMVGLGAFAKAKPDGYTLAIFNLPSNSINQINGAAPYDLNKVEWIGRLTTLPLLGLTRTDSPYKTIKDYQSATNLKVGTVGLTSGTGLSVISTIEKLGIKADVIPHDGSSQANTALLRGDIEYFPTSVSSAWSLIESGDVRPLWIFSEERDPDLPDVPTIGELGYPELLSLSNPHYSIGLPPETPENIVKAWRDAFQKAIQDPEYKEELKKMKLPYLPADAQTEKKWLTSSYEDMKKILPVVKKYE